MTRSQRVATAFYGAASAFVLMWVPWRSGPTVRGANTEVLGYGPVWSGPERPVDFVEYEKHLAQYNKSKGEPDWRDGLTGEPPKVGQAAKPSSSEGSYTIAPPPAERPQPPKEPEGYSEYPYKLSTSNVDFGRLIVEFGALTGLFLAAWMVTSAGGRESK